MIAPPVSQIEGPRHKPDPDIFPLPTRHPTQEGRYPLRKLTGKRSIFMTDRLLSELRTDDVRRASIKPALSLARNVDIIKTGNPHAEDAAALTVWYLWVVRQANAPHLCSGDEPEGAGHTRR